LKGLNRNQIKYIAIAAMLVDHIAWLFVTPYTPVWELMHFIGRFTGPAMAVFVAEAYHHTRDVGKYTLRLGLFALISWPCFSLMETGRIGPYFGVIYTLFLSLLVLRLWDAECNALLKIAGIAALTALSLLGDWPIFDVMFALAAHIWYEDKKRRWLMHTLITVISILSIAINYMDAGLPLWCCAYELGELLVPLVFYFFYNGEGGSRHPFHKWFFYIFYPLHMLVLWYFNYIA